MNDLLYKIGLTQLPGVGPVTARQLVAYCGSPKAVFEARKKELMQIPGVGNQIANAISSKKALAKAEKELAFIDQFKIKALFYLDDEYPSRLRNYPDAPALLYFKGKSSLNHHRTVAIVGTRKPSPQGIKTCEELVADLKKYDVQIMSGLAFGIDVCAHRKSLEEGIPTIGVLGHGLRQIYPVQHTQIAQQMLENGGLLSEYPHFTKPEREHFPMRNRIVAGLCDALVVVETAKKGGSMITAYMANDYNKDVFAFPGRVRDTSAQGCNFLIKTHRAALIETAEDIAYIMRWEKLEFQPSRQTQLFTELTEDEKLIVDLLRQNEGISIDHLTYKSQFKGSALATLLLNLEFKGLIKTLPGKRYMII